MTTREKREKRKYTQTKGKGDEQASKESRKRTNRQKQPTKYSPTAAATAANNNNTTLHYKK
jgi:hypothetical protein